MPPENKSENKSENIAENVPKETPSVRTFTEDMASAIEESGGGLVKNIIDEAEKEEAEKQSPQKRKNHLYAIFAIIFVIAGLVVIGLFTPKEKDSASAPLSPAPRDGLIYTESSKMIEIGGQTREEIIAAVLAERNNFSGKA